MEDQSLCSQFKLTERSKPSPLEICEDIHWQEITPVAMIITTAAILKRIEEARASGARELVGGHRNGGSCRRTCSQTWPTITPSRVKSSSARWRR
jgi:hypothetical protein